MSQAEHIPRWHYRGGDFTTAAVTWVPFAKLPIFGEPHGCYTISIFGQRHGYAEFKLSVDGEPAALSIGCPRTSGVPVVMAASFQVPVRSPLHSLAAFDTPNIVQVFVRASRHLTIKNWSVTIEKALAT